MARGPKARLFLAEDIRQEIDGKLSLIGTFPDGVVIARQMAGQAAAPVGGVVALRSLGFLVTLTEFPQDPSSFEVFAELVGVDGEAKPFSPKQQVQNPGEGRSANLIFMVTPIAFTGPGKRALRLHVGSQAIDLPYEFRVELSEAAAPPQERTEASAPPVKRRAGASKSPAKTPKPAAKKRVNKG